jgi:chromosome segregation ATPase
VQDAIAGREAAEQARDGAAAELAALRHDVDAARRDLDDAISQASARRGEAAEHLAAGEQARAKLLAVQERIRAETRALNEQETQLATARATAAGLQAAAQAAEQARDTAKAQLAALQLDADVVTRNLDESRGQAANPPKSASPVARPSSSSGPRARRGVRRHD